MGLRARTCVCCGRGWGGWRVFPGALQPSPGGTHQGAGGLSEGGRPGFQGLRLRGATGGDDGKRRWWQLGEPAGCVHVVGAWHGPALEQGHT